MQSYNIGSTVSCQAYVGFTVTFLARCINKLYASVFALSMPFRQTCIQREWSQPVSVASNFVASVLSI